ncbi:hypothetical protein [Peterkaempfera griseoplana]|uniref:hypothetical protein n=1 Tax=Peterkaempfera griseoplana TaxID=66896 RepID=UPI000B0FDCDA|nr:hypothetical protein [Peterkaempfera griseoplana]
MDLDTYRPRVPSRLEDVYYPDGILAGQSRILRCPFCDCEHWHGASLGDRNSHCTPHVVVRGGYLRINDAYGNPGYVLCEPADAVNWDLERAMAQLWVLRSRYRRIRAEHDRINPWTAAERTRKRNLREQADSLAALLLKAAVSL